MATGERKWASSSTRRGGMTVLGKVAVPKPINLPSQKLENHGMDPNVEIVPKGTLSWGGRSSSPASNPWGSSPLSIHTDNGRPSSGGSGTRPSTGGSEMAYESTSNAWGTNSRPSSASGSLTSNQASGSTLRPRSADTRPGSSQLSRFAESSTENPGAWGAAGSVDNVAHSKSENFSLASRDFPTLGSEKEQPPKNAHLSPQGGDARFDSDNVNDGRVDNLPYEDGRRPNMEKWHGDALQGNPNMPGLPQHFTPWHGASVGNPPVGVWYRGPPGGPYVPPGVPPYGPHGAPTYGPSGGPPYGPSNLPPYRPLMSPGGFPVEHHYYHPPMPVPPHGSSQPVPHNGAGPRGVHQNNGEMYRPSHPDAHFRPGMPIRPGFYPGPVPYEGYYPPPVGYCGPNDRNIPYMRPAGAPVVYDKHSTPNARDHVSSQSEPGRHGTHEKPAGSEQGTSVYRHNPHEQCKVILKQHREDHEWGDIVAVSDSQFEKGYYHRLSSHEKDQGAGSNSGVQTDSRRTSNEGEPIHGYHCQGGSQFHGIERLTDEVKHTKGVNKSSSSEVVAAPKDSGLIKRIEGLNAIAKAGGADGKQDSALYSNRDEQKSRSHMISNAHVNNESITHYKSRGGGIIDPPNSHGILAVGVSSSSRKYSISGPQIRTDYRGKGIPDLLESEGRHKNAHNGHFSIAVSSSKSDSVILEGQDQQSNKVVVQPESFLDGKEVNLFSQSASDPIDIQAQRAKKKEIAMQRAIQLQREEEERVKEQKAKAQAKLEELNMRMKLLESSTEKGEMGTEKAEIFTEEVDKASSAVKSDGKQQEAHSEQLSDAAAVLSSNTIVIGTRKLDSHLQIPMDDIRDSVSFPPRLPAGKETGSHKIDARSEPQHSGGENIALKSTKKNYKDKQNLQHQNVATEKTVKAAGDTLKFSNEAGEEVFNKVGMIAEPEFHRRTKGDKSEKNNNMVGDISSSVDIRSVTPKHSDIVKAPTHSGKLQSPSLAEATHDQTLSSSDWTPSFEPHASQLKEEAQGRVNNHSRHQNSRKQSKNQHGNRTVEKPHGTDTVVWAPVKQQKKEDSMLQLVSEDASDHAQINIKNNIVEIERYALKPATKELAQQGAVQQTTSPATNVTGSAAINKNVDKNHNWQERPPRAWRQRDSAEASYRKGPKDNPHSLVSREVHVPDSHETREEKKFSDGWNSPDEWNANAYKAPDASVPNLKEHESYNRGRRQYNKGSRNTGTYVHDREHRKDQAGKDVDIGHIQITISNNDKRDRTASHKEHDSLADNRRTKVGGGVHQNYSGENTRFVKKEPALNGDHFQSKDVNIADAPAKSDSGTMASTTLHHDKRERKTATRQVGPSHTRAQVEQAHHVEHQHERTHSSSGTRKNSNQEEWKSLEHDGRHHNQPSGRGTNSHYEYKPKGQGQPAIASADGGIN